MNRLPPYRVYSNWRWSARRGTATLKVLTCILVAAFSLYLLISLGIHMFEALKFGRVDFYETLWPETTCGLTLIVLLTVKTTREYLLFPAYRTFEWISRWLFINGAGSLRLIASIFAVLTVLRAMQEIDAQASREIGEAREAIRSVEGLPESRLRIDKLEFLNRAGQELGSENLDGAILDDIDLPNARLRSGRLQGASLRRANLRIADLTNANLTGRAVLDSADLTGATLTRVRLTGASLSNTTVDKTIALAGELQGIKLNGQDISEAHFDGKDLTGAEFVHVNLEGATFVGTTLNNATFDSAEMDAAVLDGATTLRGAQFHNVNLAGFTFYLPKDTLSDYVPDSTRPRIMQAAKFHGCDLTECRLDSYDPYGIRFDNSIMKKAVLDGARLTNSSFLGVDLRGASLAGISGWTERFGITHGNIAGVEDDPPGFRDWALKNGAVEIADDVEWQAYRKAHDLPQPFDASKQ